MLELKCQENARAIAQQIKTSGGASQDYSSDPHVIGKWVDGETDVYEVTLALTTPNVLQTTTVIHTFDSLLNVIEFNGIIDGKFALNEYLDENNHVRTNFNVVDGKTVIHCNVDGESLFKSKSMSLTMRYTIPTI